VRVFYALARGPVTLSAGVLWAEGQGFRQPRRLEEWSATAVRHLTREWFREGRSSNIFGAGTLKTRALLKFGRALSSKAHQQGSAKPPVNPSLASSTARRFTGPPMLDARSA
jgi:hypothetical protein